ncbi:MAG: UPF0182 family protein [Vicinamibacterales bacterium]
MQIRSFPGLALLAFVAFLVLPSAAVFWTDWLWFIEMGYLPVFQKTLRAQALTFGASFLLAFGFLYGNLRLARASFRQPQLVLGATVDGRPVIVESRRIDRLALYGSLIVALLTALSVAGDWLAYLQFAYGVPFGHTDPIFGRDISFYVFRFPVWDEMQARLFMLALLALAGSFAVYLISGNVLLESRWGFALWPRVEFRPRVRLHLALLVSLLLLLLAFGAWLDGPRMLLTDSDVLFGAGYADVHARLPILRIKQVILIAAAVMAALHAVAARRWLLPFAVGLYLATVVAGGIYAGFVQRFVVTPNEQTKEQPFLVNNIAATRRAFGVDQVIERELSGEAELTESIVSAHRETIENVRLWDHQPLLQTFGQVQEIRTYYDFNSVDNDRYVIDGRYRQVMLSARELNTESLPNPTWVNERLTFTHGYGVTLGPVNEATTEGMPVLFIKDLPPVSSVDLRVEEPSIYYGELSSDYVLVRSKEPEFHYPRGEDNVMSVYNGTGGVPLGGFLRRLAFAARFQATNLLVTAQLTPDSRLLFHRRIDDRVRAIAPFLTYDRDPYLVISEGRLFWMQDAYTTTRNYPYSTPTPGRRAEAIENVNYIRNSVKIVIDAYNGTTTFYIADPADPLVITLSRVFPALFTPLHEMPQGLREHIRYPEDIFDLQAHVYATYHMTNPGVFYNKEDQWEVPSLETASATADATRPRTDMLMEPYYTVMRLPGEGRAEFIQMLPFTPRLKENLSAWMVARSDGEHYGKLMVFQFPKQTLVYGPRQVVTRISQDEVISQQITLWNQAGSTVIRGTLLVIPIEESLLYVQPLYLRAAGGRIPELKRVIVAYKDLKRDRIVMAETLPQALSQVFSTDSPAVRAARGAAQAEAEGAPPPSTPAATRPDAGLRAGATLAELAAQANAHFTRATAAQREGNWALYGQEMEKLRQVLAAMAKLPGGSPPPR